MVMLFVPFTVGGGIRSADDAAAVFDAGADKVSINSSAIARPELIGDRTRRGPGTNAPYVSFAATICFVLACRVCHKPPT